MSSDSERQDRCGCVTVEGTAQTSACAQRQTAAVPSHCLSGVMAAAEVSHHPCVCMCVRVLIEPELT